MADLLAEEGDDVLGHGEVDFTADAEADIADEIEGDDGDVVAVDVQPDGEGAVGIDHQLGRRLAAAAQLAPGLEDHAVVQQTLGYIGDGRGREAGQVGDFGTGDRRARRSHRLKRNPLIVVTRTLEIRSGQRITQRMNPGFGPVDAAFVRGQRLSSLPAPSVGACTA